MHLKLPNLPLGPVFRVTVGVSAERREALVAQGLSIPETVTGIFLLDTGASKSAVDLEVAEQLRLKPTDSDLVHSAHGSHEAKMCDVSLRLEGEPVHAIETIQVMLLDLRPQGIKGLIGRDVLCLGIFTYDGVGGGSNFIFEPLHTPPGRSTAGVTNSSPKSTNDRGRHHRSTEREALASSEHPDLGRQLPSLNPPG